MKKLKIMVLAILSMALIIFTGCGNSAQEQTSSTSENEEITIQHKMGETTLHKNPQRVVVIDFGILDSLDKLNVPVIGVAKDILPAYLDKYKDDKYANVGNLMELDLEKINQLKPDLIIISGRQEKYYDDLSKIAPTIDLQVDQQNYMASFKDNMYTLATIFGKEDEVNSELSQIDNRIDVLKGKIAASDSKGLMIMTTGGKLHAFGPQSRFTLLYDVLGMKSVMQDDNSGDKAVQMHGQVISFEYIAQSNPDYMLVMDRDSAIGKTASAKTLLDNDLVNATKAAKNNKIIYLDSGIWYLSGGGLISTEKMLDDIETAYAD